MTLGYLPRAALEPGPLAAQLSVVADPAADADALLRLRRDDARVFTALAARPGLARPLRSALYAQARGGPMLLTLPGDDTAAAATDHGPGPGARTAAWAGAVLTVPWWTPARLTELARVGGRREAADQRALAGLLAAHPATGPLPLLTWWATVLSGVRADAGHPQARAATAGLREAGVDGSGLADLALAWAAGPVLVNVATLAAAARGRDGAALSLMAALVRERGAGPRALAEISAVAGTVHPGRPRWGAAC